MIDGIERDDARQYFKNKGLSYYDITNGDICTLVMLLNKHIKRACKEGKMSTTTMHMSEKINIKSDSHGRIKSCFLYINSHYFTRRECISFNEDGFIGFAGWADDRNMEPIKKAFKEWCDNLAPTGEKK
ncbi:MAG: hypothetical protein PHE79_12085 [Eubacteriales bacterium]|nr:hypothetical protein [Eubacteriales bacterium]